MIFKHAAAPGYVAALWNGYITLLQCNARGISDPNDVIACRTAAWGVACFHAGGTPQLCGQLLLQVHTAQQNAIRMVAAYPNIMNITIYEALAEQYGQPSLTDIMNQQPSAQLSLSWDDVAAYVQTINVQNMFRYVPFVATCNQRHLCPAS